MAFVVDNSVVVAWHFHSQATPSTDRARRKLLTETAYVPSLWSLEFANVLKKAVRGKRISEAEAFSIIQQQYALPFVVNHAPVAADTVLQLALRHELSSYDASYLEMALRLKLPLATKDEALQKAAINSGVGLL